MKVGLKTNILKMSCVSITVNVWHRTGMYMCTGWSRVSWCFWRWHMHSTNTLGFIEVPEQTCTKGLHIHVSLVKNYVLQMYTLPWQFTAIVSLWRYPWLIRRAKGIQAVSCWMWAFSPSVVWRVVQTPYWDISTRSSLELLGQTTLVAIMHRQIEIMHLGNNLISVTQLLHHLHFVRMVV